jgi:hypothetical protein
MMLADLKPRRSLAKRVMMAGAVSFQFAEDVRKKEKNPSARIA